MALPGRSLWLPVAYMIPTNSNGPLGTRVAGVPAPGHLTRGPNGAQKRLRSDPSLRAVADHSAAPRGRFAAILGSLSSESSPRVTSATHLWTVGPTMASNRQYCVTV